MTHELLTSREVAEILRVAPFTVVKWCRKGKLRASKVGKDWRIDRQAVDALLDVKPEAV